MTLSDIADFSTTISGIAVTVSLIYLAVQTHQNVRHNRALIHQGRVAALRDIFLARVDANVAAATIVATGGKATAREVQQVQFMSMCGAMIYGWQDTYEQYRNGLLDEDFFLQMCTGATQQLAQPAFREAWQAFRVPGTRFAAFMDPIAASFDTAG